WKHPECIRSADASGCFHFIPAALVPERYCGNCADETRHSERENRYHPSNVIVVRRRAFPAISSLRVPILTS
ncbi:MAG: hypothetical protein ACI8WY_001742, partial [Planctomycetota bacterium]